MGLQGPVNLRERRVGVGEREGEGKVRVDLRPQWTWALGGAGFRSPRCGGGVPR